MQARYASRWTRLRSLHCWSGTRCDFRGPKVTRPRSMPDARWGDPCRYSVHRLGCSVALRVVIRLNNGSDLDENGPHLKIRTEIDRFLHFWTEVPTVRDREAPGSNPGPPTISEFRSVKYSYT